MMPTIRMVGQCITEDGATRNAVVELAVDGAAARVTVSALADPTGTELPTHDRRIAYFLGRVEQTIRAIEYRNRPVMPDPKPKERAGAKSKRHS